MLMLDWSACKCLQVPISDYSATAQTATHCCKFGRFAVARSAKLFLHLRVQMKGQPRKPDTATSPCITLTIQAIF